MWTNVCLCVCRFICLRVWLTRQRSCCVRSSAGSPTDRSECDSSKVASTTWPTTGKEWLWKLSGVLTWKISIVSLFRRKFFLGLKFESKKKTQVTSFMIHKTEKQYFVSVFISFLLFFCSCFWPSFSRLPSGPLWFLCVCYPNFSALSSSSAPATTLTGSPCKEH